MKIFIRLIFVFFTWLACSFSNAVHAQELKPKTTRILFLLDASSSMLDAWNPDLSRFEASSSLIGQIMDSIIAVNDNVEFGLRVFGHQHIVTQQNCYDTRMEVKFRKLAMEQIKVKLRNTSPMGVSPIAWSLQEAALMDLTDNNNYAYSIILITDGGESCGGNICEVMEKIVNYKINFQPYIVSMLDYAPLQKEYECMGKYMKVTKPADFQPVIHTIMEDNNYFKANEQTKYIPIVTKVVPTITVTKVDTPTIIIPIKKPEPTTTTAIKIKTVDKMALVGIPKPYIKYKATTIIFPTIRIAKLAPFKFKEEVVIVPEVVVPTKKTELIAKIGTGDFVKPRLKYSIPTKNNFKGVIVKKLPAFKFTIEPEAPAIITIAKLSLKDINTKWRMPSLFTIPVYNKVAIKKLPKFNIVLEPERTVVVTPPQTNATVPKIDVSKTETNIVSEKKNDEAAPGTFQIFYTNGKGKYYKSMPQIVIKDLKTKKEVYKGVRKMLPGGVPEEMTLPEGNYEVISTQSGRSATFNVVNGKNQKVEVVVGFGSLSFIHPGTKEFAKGYTAMVSKRFEGNDPAVSHATELVLTYEPSNYHIEINTLPPLLYNIDLEFDYSYQIAIPKTGNVQVMNENDLGRIIFYHESAENYIPFYEMNVYGDTEYQKIEFLPGKYQVRYFLKDAAGKSKLKVKEFKLESLKQVILNLD